MKVCLARGTLILPLWKSSFFWNVCATDGAHWSRFVIDWIYLPKFQGLFVKGKARNSLFGTRPLLMSLLCESTFAVPGPLYVARGFALCLMESVTLVIRRYFSLVFCTPLRELSTMFSCRRLFGLTVALYFPCDKRFIYLLHFYVRLFLSFPLSVFCMPLFLLSVFLSTSRLFLYPPDIFQSGFWEFVQDPLPDDNNVLKGQQYILAVPPHLPQVEGFRH